MSNRNRKILLGGLLAVIAGLVITAILLYAIWPRTVGEAIAWGNIRILEKILQKEGLETGSSAPAYLADTITWLPYSYSRRDYTPTDKQIARRNEITYNMVKLLVEYGADIDQPSKSFSDRTPLRAAFFWRMPDVVNYLIEQGASVNIFYGDNLYSPLMYAASDGYTVTVQLLLERNAKETINHARNDGNTALHLASDSEICKLLLDNGADPTIRNNKGQTPLEQAREYNWKDKAALLEKSLESNEKQ
jgi:ankyrin repeat protein